MIRAAIYFLALLGTIHLPAMCGQAKLSQIQYIPPKDLIAIRQLFQYLLWDEQALFAYTLHGSKPISFTCFPRDNPQNRSAKHPLKHLNALWNTWRLYHSMFPIQQYALFAKEENDCLVIYLINKQTCLEKIDEHLLLFQEKLNCTDSAEDILARIITSKNFLKNGLNNSHALLGILLGYGKENALDFERHYFGDHQLCGITPEPLDIGDHHEKFPVPSFAMYSIEESENLMTQYEQQREEILRKYKNGCFLDTVLSQLMKKTENAN